MKYPHGKAYRRGQKDRQQNKSVHCNPFTDEEQREAWRAGWKFEDTRRRGYSETLTRAELDRP